MPTVNTITNTATAVSGKTEAYATVTVTISGKSYSAKADSAGNYKVTIPVQNAGTSLSVSAKASKGNISAVMVTKVTQVAPNLPSVNQVKSSSTAVTGKTEKYTTVLVKIGARIYQSKASSDGYFKVSIPKQKAGTSLYVQAKNSKGQVSATRKVNVSI